MRALSRALFPCLTHDHLPQKEVLIAAADEDKHLFLQVRERKERTIKREREIVRKREEREIENESARERERERGRLRE